MMDLTRLVLPVQRDRSCDGTRHLDHMERYLCCVMFNMRFGRPEFAWSRIEEDSISSSSTKKHLVSGFGFTTLRRTIGNLRKHMETLEETKKNLRRLWGASREGDVTAVRALLES
jgi:hypothetical protein